jgi:hypothetical protein
MISLSYSGITLFLNPDLYWADEFEWNPVEQTAERSITGALIVQSGMLISGKPITLQPIDESSAWTPLSDVSILQTWASIPGLEMVLNLRGVDRNVIFRHEDRDAMVAKPVVHFSTVDTTDNYLVNLKFTEV